MAATDKTQRVLLLVEDNPADAYLVAQLLVNEDTEAFSIIHVTTLNAAVQYLHAHTVDVVLLDLHLPDGKGLTNVRALQAVSQLAPIVVLTGIEDEELALACIGAGAQDYLIKGGLQTPTLRRALGYAISRVQEVKMRELQETLEQYRALSAVASATAITAALSGSGSVRERYPNVFREFVKDYLQLLSLYLDQLILRKEKPFDQMERLVSSLGDAGGGPKDLLDVHVTALDKVAGEKASERSRSLAIESRLLALEMMGLLVDYYRVGRRHHFH